MKFSSIASGSKGNCLLYENNDIKLLVDAGLHDKCTGLTYPIESAAIV